jgi:hypothetical protein
MGLMGGRRRRLDHREELAADGDDVAGYGITG